MDKPDLLAAWLSQEFVSAEPGFRDATTSELYEAWCRRLTPTREEFEVQLLQDMRCAGVKRGTVNGEDGWLRIPHFYEQ